MTMKQMAALPPSAAPGGGLGGDGDRRQGRRGSRPARVPAAAGHREPAPGSRRAGLAIEGGRGGEVSVGS